MREKKKKGPMFKGLFTYSVSQMGGSRPPLHPYQKKIRNWVTLPPPLVRNHILSHANKLGKPTFQEEISNFERNLTYVKY